MFKSENYLLERKSKILKPQKREVNRKNKIYKR